MPLGEASLKWGGSSGGGGGKRVSAQARKSMRLWTDGLINSRRLGANRQSDGRTVGMWPCIQALWPFHKRELWRFALSGQNKRTPAKGAAGLAPGGGGEGWDVCCVPLNVTPFNTGKECHSGSAAGQQIKCTAPSFFSLALSIYLLDVCELAVCGRFRRLFFPASLSHGCHRPSLSAPARRGLSFSRGVRRGRGQVDFISRRRLHLGVAQSAGGGREWRHRRAAREEIMVLLGSTLFQGVEFFRKPITVSHCSLIRQDGR